MAKFCANLSFMFTEVPFIRRYEHAARAGFKAVESGFPPDSVTLDEVVSATASAKVQQILINTYSGNALKGEFGFAALPGKEDEFKESINKTLNYAKCLKIKKIHIMSGVVNDGITNNHDEVFEKNLRYAISLFEKEGIIGLIEPINKYSLPNYYMNCYTKALDFVKKIDSPNLKLMLDIFHLQQIRGDITNSIASLLPFVGHVQIAQVPNRHEPNVPGEIDYQYVLNFLASSGYEDWIGLEYRPRNSNDPDLKWITTYGFHL